MAVTKLFIIESQPAVGRGLHFLLDAEADLSIVGEALDCETALQVVEAIGPDVVLMDLDGPYSLERAAVGALHRICGCAPVVMLTFLDNVQTSQLAQQAGAAAIVVKSAPADALLDAIRQVSQQHKH